ncbi:MAG: SAM-dependent methyltransferase, partial [Herpetosiphonaceae bacterium]|nr:SAM-dependent methyltransferase [Herpetosiphonaceae bacterium]
SERRVAIGCIGLAYFLDDAALSGLMQALYDWAAPGSSMALSQAYGEIITSNNQAALDAFKRSGAEIFLRNEAEIRHIVAPWHVREIKPLATWLNMENMLDESDRSDGNAEMFGLILERM